MDEPFVMSSVERAQEWVSACSKSVEIPAEQSAALLASLCGFGSWDVMVFGIQSLRPSTCDELVDQAVFKSRAEHYATVLMVTYGYTAELSRAIINFMSPSSTKEFKGFEASDIERVLLDGEPVDDEFNIDMFFGALSSDVRKEVIGPFLGLVTDQGWMSALKYLGWPVESIGNDEEFLGEPSLEIIDSRRGAGVVPVYLSHSLPPPAFLTEMNPDDMSVRLLQCACLGNFVSVYAPRGATDFLILATLPQVKTVNGKWYCFIGVAYNSVTRKWTDILINSQCRDIETILSLSRGITSLHDDFAMLAEVKNVTQLRKGAAALAENDYEFATHLARLLSGYDPELESEDEWTVVGMPTGDGWTVLGATPQWDYYREEVLPYVFDGTTK